MTRGRDLARTRTGWRSIGAAALLLSLLGACVPPGELEEIKTQQAQILEKLDALTRKLDAGAAPRPVASRPSEDFDRAYSIDVGSSPIRGNPNAAVTLVAYPSAKPAAVAAVAAQEQGRFWEFHDTLFKNQAALALQNWEALAKEAGLDVARFRSDLEQNAAPYEQRVDADLQQGRSVDVRATPTLYINGKKVADYRNLEGMSAMVEAALRK